MSDGTGVTEQVTPHIEARGGLVATFAGRSNASVLCRGARRWPTSGHHHQELLKIDRTVVVGVGDGDERRHLGVRDANTLFPQCVAELGGIDGAWKPRERDNKTTPKKRKGFKGQTTTRCSRWAEAAEEARGISGQI